MDPNAKNNDGHTPLHTACRNERSEQVKLLVRDERCNLNENDGSGNAPQLLHLAVKHKDKELVKLLVRDERCNPHEKDSRGDTALHIACRLSYGGIGLIALINCFVCDSLTTICLSVFGTNITTYIHL